MEFHLHMLENNILKPRGQVLTENSSHFYNKASSKFWPNNDNILYYYNKRNIIIKRLERNPCLPPQNYQGQI